MPFLQITLYAKFFLPSSFQSSRYQAILRFDRVILSRSSFCLVSSAFEPLLPKFVCLLALTLNILSDLKADLQSRRHESLQSQADHLVVQRLGRQTLTGWITIKRCVCRAIITRFGGRPAVLRTQAVPTSATHHEAG